MKTFIHVAIIQSSPVFFDKKRTLDKIFSLIKKTDGKADLILFPEAFIPGYPRLMTFGTRVGGRTEEGRDTWAAYYENAMDVPGPETLKLGKLARQYNAYLSIGVIERETGSLYCTQPIRKITTSTQKIK